MADVNIVDVRKKYGRTEVVHGVNVDIKDKEFVVLVGPSGCGKSTLLRMVAGLEGITDGEIRIDGRRVNELPPKQRGCAMVFQNYALYPHMKVFDNMAFSLMLAKASKSDIEQRVKRAAKALAIEDYLDRYPKELSGGQRQRVAMGRAIVRDPQVFLFDEPLSNLDAQLRIAMRTEIRALHQRLGATSIYVTHDQVEAMTMADRMVVMNAGGIEQVGAPLDVYDRPRTLHVARFVGAPAINVFDAVVDDASPARRVVTKGGAPIADAGGARAGRAVSAAVRPEHVDIDERGALAGTIGVVENLGHQTYVFVETADGRVCLLVDRARRPRQGDAVRLAVRAAHVHLFDPATGQRIS